MPGPIIWNWTPQGAGWNRQPPLMPSYQAQWSPNVAIPHAGAAGVTEVGGGMLNKGVGQMYGMNGGMGDMFVYPQGAGPDDFYRQQIATGAMPAPGSEEFQSTGPREGSMSWEGGPAPWEQGPASPQQPFLPPDQAPEAIAAMEASRRRQAEVKAVEAAKAAKVAADNAIRAANAGAPTVATTNAATAQAAANVAAKMAVSPAAQQAAAIAAGEATKAVAAANVAVARANGNGNGNGRANGNGMNDWMELSGLRGLGQGGGGDFVQKYKWPLLLGAGLFAAWYTKGKLWGKE